MTYVEADIGTALIAAGYSSTRIRYYRWDEAAANEILVIPAAGTGIITSTNTLQKPKVQIQVRASSGSSTHIQAAKAEIWAIINLFHQSTSVTNTTGIIWDMRDPDFWEDDNGRGIFSVEFDVYKTVS